MGKRVDKLIHEMINRIIDIEWSASNLEDEARKEIAELKERVERLESIIQLQTIKEDSITTIKL